MVPAHRSVYRVWNPASGKQLRSFPKPESSGLSDPFVAGKNSLACWDTRRRELQVWDLARGKLRWAAPHADQPGLLAFDPTGKELWVGGQSFHTITVHDALKGRPLARRYEDKSASPGPGGAPIRLAFSPDGKSFLASSRDASVRLWDARAATTTWKITPSQSYMGAKLGFLAGGTQFFTAARGAPIRLWDTKTGSLVKEIPTGPKVIDVAFSPDRTQAVASFDDEELRVYAIPSGKIRQRIPLGQRERTTSLAFGPKGRFLLESLAGPLEVWQSAPLPKQEGLWTGVLPESYRHLAFAEDGSQLVASSLLRGVSWDLSRGQAGRLLFDHRDKRGSDSFLGRSRDGSVIVSASQYDLRVYAGAELKLKRTIQLDGEQKQVVIAAGALSGDGRWLGLVRQEFRKPKTGVVELYDLSGDEVRKLKEGVEQGSALAFEPKGALLALSSSFGRLSYLPIKGGRAPQETPKLSGSSSFLSFCAGGEALLVGSSARGGAPGGPGATELTLWDVARDQARRSLRLAGRPSGIALTPKETLAAVGTRAGAVHIVDLEKLRVLQTIEVAPGKPATVAISPDGKRLAVSAGDETRILLMPEK